MFGYIKMGAVIGRRDTSVTILPEGMPLGLTVTDGGCLGPPGTQVEDVWIHEVWNRDGQPSYFAFLNEGCIQLFQLFTLVPSVGPGRAASIIHAHGYEQCLAICAAGGNGLASGVHGVSAKKGVEIAEFVRDHLPKLPAYVPADQEAATARKTILALHGQVDEQLLAEAVSEYDQAKKIVAHYNIRLREVNG